MKYDIKNIRVVVMLLATTLVAIQAKLEVMSPPALKDEFEGAESLIT